MMNYLSLTTVGIKITSLWLMGFLVPSTVSVLSQTSATVHSIQFYGNRPSATEMGGEYLVFQQRGDQIQGLIYVQNSDIFACLQGNYNAQQQQIEQIQFSYPDLGTENWETVTGDEPLNLADYPYPLNYHDINENADSIFLDCLERLNS